MKLNNNLKDITKNLANNLNTSVKNKFSTSNIFYGHEISTSNINYCNYSTTTTLQWPYVKQIKVVELNNCSKLLKLNDIQNSTLKQKLGNI